MKLIHHVHEMEDLPSVLDPSFYNGDIVWMFFFGVQFFRKIYKEFFFCFAFETSVGRQTVVTDPEVFLPTDVVAFFL